MNTFLEDLYYDQCRPFLNLGGDCADTPAYLALDATLSPTQRNLLRSFAETARGQANRTAYLGFCGGMRFSISLLGELFGGCG